MTGDQQLGAVGQLTEGCRGFTCLHQGVDLQAEAAGARTVCALLGDPSRGGGSPRPRRLFFVRRWCQRSSAVRVDDGERGTAPPCFAGRLVKREFAVPSLVIADGRGFRGQAECLVGILALLYGAASQEVRLLTIDGIDAAGRTIRLGERPLPVALDPASWQVLQQALEHRASQRTDNPHVIVTRGTKVGRSAASTAYLSHVLDGCGIAPRTVRIELVNTMDPKLVAAAFGMNPEGVMLYMSDRVDDTRLPEGRITQDV